MEDLAGLELSGTDGEKMQKMIQLVEQNLTRRMIMIEDKMEKIGELEEEIQSIKENGVNAKPTDDNSKGATPEQIAKWDGVCLRSEELAKLIQQNQIDLAMLQGDKIKSDITTLKQQVMTFVTKESIERMTEDVKKIRIEIADNGYEVQIAKDQVRNSEKLIDSNQKELKQSIQTLRTKGEQTSEAQKVSKQQIGMLDEKLRTFIKNMQLSGGAAMAGEGNIVQEIEDSLQKLKDDMEEWRKTSGNERIIIMNDLQNKFTKKESTVMEDRLLERMQGLVG